MRPEILPPAPADVEPDAHEPRPESLGVSKAADAEQRGKRRLLHDIVDGLGVTERPPADGDEHLLVALEELREGSPIARPGGIHEGRIARAGPDFALHLTRIVPSERAGGYLRRAQASVSDPLPRLGREASV